MKEELEHIDGLFKDKLSGVEAAPSSALKSVLIKKISIIALKKTIFSYALILLSGGAVYYSSTLAYDSYKEEQRKLAFEQINAISPELARAFEYNETNAVSMELLGSSINNTSFNKSFLTEKEVNETPEFLANTKSNYETLASNSESNLDLNNLVQSTDASRDSYNALTKSITTDNKKNSNLEGHSTASVSEDDSLLNNSFFVMDASEVVLSSHKSDAALNQPHSSISIASNSTEESADESNVLGLENNRGNYPTSKDENSNVLKPTSSKHFESFESLSLIEAKSYIPTQLALTPELKNLPSIKARNLINGAISFGISSKMEALNSTHGSTMLDDLETGISFNLESSIGWHNGVMIEKDLGAINVGFGLEKSEITNSYSSINQFHQSYTYDTEETSLVPYTIDGEEVLNEDGEPILVAVTETITHIDSTLISQSNSVRNKLNYISIPLNVSFDMFENRRFSVGLNGSFRYSRLISTSGQTFNESSELISLADNSALAETNILSTTLGFTFKKSISNRLALSVSPGHTFYLNNLWTKNKNEKTSVSGNSLRFGLNYSF